MFISLIIFSMIFRLGVFEMSNYTFPENFAFGVATSAYQIEGAWNEDGRGPSVWDDTVHKNPRFVDDHSNGDVACDSYHKWEEDVRLIKELGVNFYRFSISWSRILPEGKRFSKVNREGVLYYNKLIDALLKEGIEPFVTMFHWDTPQALEARGGWLNESIIDDFVHYSELLFKLYGDRVRRWITFNEPKQTCEEGYATAEKAPFMRLNGVGGYSCYHHVVIAHGKVYRMYEQKFKPQQKGQVGITIDTYFGFPKTDSESDKRAAERYLQFNFGRFAHPILSGDYPPIVIQRVAELSKRQGLRGSRLPKFTDAEIEMIKGSYDFLGLNHYTSVLCSFDDKEVFPSPSVAEDCGVKLSRHPSWQPSVANWLWSVPRGMSETLLWIKNTYNNPPVLITENGWATPGNGLNDTERVNYMRGYLSEVLRAIKDYNCNVIGYTAWSLLDNFEWTFGYTQRYGIVDVDFSSPNLTRTPRESYRTYQKILSSKRVVN